MVNDADALTGWRSNDDVHTIISFFLPPVDLIINSLFNLIGCDISNNITGIKFTFMITALHLHPALYDFIRGNAMISFHLETVAAYTG